MTTIERNAISSPAEGLVVYDTDLNAEFFYNGSSWINPLVSSDIGVTVQGYDAGTLVSSDIGVTVQGYDADTAKTDVVQTYSAVQIFNQNIRANRAILQVVSTSKILSLGDANMEMEMNSASPQTLTVPPNSSVAFLEGTEIEVIQIGAGSVAIVAGAGVTINTKSSLVLNGQYASAILKKRAVNTWTLTGDTI
jgi:citrate lyase gamma subunit